VKNTFASRVFSTPVAPVVVVAPAGDGRMEDESSIDDDPFDQFFTYGAIDVSSGLQATRDSSAVDDESVSGENAVKGGVARVDVRIRGEFLRYKDNVEASQPTHRRSLGAAFDNVSVKSRWAQMTAELTQLALDPEFTFEPDEAAHITDTLEKLYRYMHNLKTYGEASPSMSENSKTDGDGVIGASNLVAIPTTGAARDTASSRKRGCHEKMVDEHKRKASKGEQISTRNYLS
jgi:hypothetical protein